MIFHWKNFPEYNYNLYLNGGFSPFDCIGSVRIGDICIDFVNYTTVLKFDFYVAHEDTGYAHTENGIPYSYCDGIEAEIPVDVPYAVFKAEAEKLFEKYILDYQGVVSLQAHSNKPLEIW